MRERERERGVRERERMSEREREGEGGIKWVTFNYACVCDVHYSSTFVH